MIDEKVLFTSSLDLSNHPMNNVKPKLKKQYYLVLEYFVNEQTDNKFTASRLKQYRIKLLNSPDYVEKETNIKQIIQSIINNRIKPWRKKYRYWIMCDVALILMDDDLINKTAIEMKTYMSQRQQKKFEVLLTAFKDDAAQSIL